MDSKQHVDLVELYRDFDARCATSLDFITSAREYELELYVPSIDTRDKAQRELESLMSENHGLEAPDPVFQLLKDHFDEFIKGQISSLKRMFDAPSSFVSRLSSSIDYYSRKDSRNSVERAKILLSRLGRADEMWAGVQRLLPETPIDEVSQLEEVCDTLAVVAEKMAPRVPQLYSGLTENTIAQLQFNLEQVSNKARTWAAEVREFVDENRYRLEGRRQEIESGEDPIEAYRRLLLDQFGVELDEILKWHEEEIEKTRSDMLEIANKIDVLGVPKANSPKDVVDILNQFQGPCDTPDEMFVRMRQYLDRAQEAARKYVKLPKESVVVVPTPDTLVKHYPWGGYGGGCPRRRPLQGETFLNVQNYKAITDGWIKMNAIHECYPGHHVQWVRSVLDPLPETVKIGARGVPNSEGSAHRSEKLMEFVYEEDPFYPLFVAYRRHHTAVRIKADLWLRYFGRSFDEVVDLYVEELAFDRKVAEGQVLAQKLMAGYFTCYYYGMKKLLDLESEFGYDEKSFTEVIFSLPRVSLRTLENFLKMSDEDKNRFLNEFPSKVTL
ncbi:MAG TPA: DUF885 family protein [Bacillota bacterium]|nr:DUF885 family protein [Bacillota bacterium]HPZ78139.1 DUF885 family protein [Bacillota bacterium]HQD74377.1 DUF885 family protein [Bacillota bacterium]